MRDRDEALGHALGEACLELAIRLQALFREGVGTRHTGSEVQDDYTLLDAPGASRGGPSCAWTFGPYAARSRFEGAIFLVPEPRIVIGLDRRLATALIAVRAAESGGIVFPTSRNDTGFWVIGGDPITDVTGEDGPWRAHALAGLARVAACCAAHEDALDAARAAAYAREAQAVADARAARRAALDTARGMFTDA